jgi:hypothetical protein
MSEIDSISQRVLDLERRTDKRLHEHGKHISRIEGVYDERTRHLAEADASIRMEVAGLGSKIDKLMDRIMEGRIRLAVGVGAIAAIGGTGIDKLLSQLGG